MYLRNIGMYVCMYKSTTRSHNPEELCHRLRRDRTSSHTAVLVMVKCGVLFEVRTGFLNNIYTSFGFKGLTNMKAPLSL
jgi:hypothetical protein